MKHTIWISAINDYGPQCFPVHPTVFIAPTHDEAVSKLIEWCKESWQEFCDSEPWPDTQTPLEPEYGVDALQAYSDMTESPFMVFAINLDTMEHDLSEINPSNNPGLVMFCGAKPA